MNSATAKMSGLEMISLYRQTDNAGGTQRDRGVMMTSISFYLDNLGNRRRVFATHAIKSRVGKLKTRVGKLKNFGAMCRI